LRDKQGGKGAGSYPGRMSIWTERRNFHHDPPPVQISLDRQDPSSSLRNACRRYETNLLDETR
jgi:hypothetical protein